MKFCRRLSPPPHRYPLWLELLSTTSRYVPALFESSSVPVIVIIIIIINYKSRRKRRTLVASVEGGVGRGKPRYFGLLAFATRELSIAAEHCIINYCFYPRAPISWGLYHTHTHTHAPGPLLLRQRLASSRFRSRASKIYLEY